MVNIRDLAVSIEAAGSVDPTIERWLGEVRNLDRRLVEMVVLLCLHANRLPEQVLLKYTRVLHDVLENAAQEEEYEIPDRLNQRIDDFLVFLESSGKHEQASSIREAISGG